MASLPSNLLLSRRNLHQLSPIVNNGSATPQRAIPILDPSDLVGRTFLLDKEDGQHIRARIVKAIDDYEGDIARDSSCLKFVCTMQDDTVEETSPATNF